MHFQCIQQNCVPETKHSGTRGLLQSTVLRKMDMCVYLTKTLRNCLNFVTHPLLYGYSKVINTCIRASFKHKKLYFVFLNVLSDFVQIWMKLEKNIRCSIFTDWETSMILVWLLNNLHIVYVIYTCKCNPFCEKKSSDSMLKQEINIYKRRTKSKRN